MAAEKENTINIDDYRIFNNPFEKFEPSEDSFKLFEKYLDCKANKDILQKIGDNKITSSEYSGFGPTKDEILRKVACKNNYRTKPTIVYRDVLNNTSGIIVQQVNCEGPIMGGKLAEAISIRYKEVEPIYNNLKVKIPGSIQMINLINDKNYPLYLCNLFGKKKECSSEEWEGFLRRKHFLKRGLNRLRIYMKKYKLQDLPVYIPYNMGEFQGWDWTDYEPVIMKYLPTAVICRL